MQSIDDILLGHWAVGRGKGGGRWPCDSHCLQSDRWSTTDWHANEALLNSVRTQQRRNENRFNDSLVISIAVAVNFDVSVSSVVSLANCCRIQRQIIWRFKCIPLSVQIQFNLINFLIFSSFNWNAIGCWPSRTIRDWQNANECFYFPLQRQCVFRIVTSDNDEQFSCYRFKRFFTIYVNTLKTGFCCSPVHL